MVDPVLQKQLLGPNGRIIFIFSEYTCKKKGAQQFYSLGSCHRNCFGRFLISYLSPEKCCLPFPSIDAILGKSGLKNMAFDSNILAFEWLKNKNPEINASLCNADVLNAINAVYLFNWSFAYDGLVEHCRYRLMHPSYEWHSSEKILRRAFGCIRQLYHWTRKLRRRT